MMTLSTTQIGRRSILRYAASLPGAAIVGMPKLTHAGSKLPFDPLSPQDNVDAVIRILGDSEGRRTYSWHTGRFFAQVEGEAAVPLFNFESAGSMVFERLAPHCYRRKFIAILIFKDMETGETLDRWVNPFTKEMNTPEFMYGGPGTIIQTPNGMVSEEVYADGSYAELPPFIWTWRTAGDTVWVTRDVLKKSPFVTEFQTYQMTLSDLASPASTSVDAALTMTAQFDWYPWMHMGDIEGSIVWHSTSAKVENVSDLPQSFVKEAESLWPNSILDPENAKPRSA